MVELNHRERTIKVKVVYYGPPVGGKTTNLQVLHQHAQAARRGELISINSAQDRTILFDLLPLKAQGLRGFDLRLQVLAVPGQAMYAATRRLVLKGADSCVFVANSAADRWEENIQSFREMTQNLLAHQLDPQALPLVLQYNKRDLPQVTPMDFMDRALNARKVDAIPAVAVRGEGVLETFSAILLRTVQDLAQRYQIIDNVRGQTLSQWTQQAVVGMFGTTSLALEPNPLAAESTLAPGKPTPPGLRPEPPPPPPERRVRITVPPEAEKMAAAGPDARANETLVESYAQASTQLTVAMTELREERDVMRRRLEDLQQILATAQDFIAGQPMEPTLRSVLGRLADAAGASHASFLLLEADKNMRAAAFRGGLVEDPLLRQPTGARHVAARFLQESEPRVHLSADSLDLGDALDASDARLGAVTSVPVRTPRGLLGLALLYHAPDAALPRADVLAHLAMVSRALSASLELAATLETVRNAERSLQLAIAGTASVRGLEEVVAFLEQIRDEFGAMRRRPDIPSWFLQEFVRLAPGLSGALATARSLLAFTRGEVAREPVALAELADDVAGENVQLQMGADAGSVVGDRVLLRLALKALLDQARGGPSGSDVATPVRITSEAGRVRISVTEPPPRLGVTPAAHGHTASGLGLSFARRVAELHGGTLSVEEAAAGSRFVLSLLPAG